MAIQPDPAVRRPGAAHARAPRSSTSTRSCARWSPTSPTPCSTRPAPASPRRRSASGCGSSPGTSTARSATWSTRSLDLSEEIQDGPEGCLSLPELTYDCKRALSVVANGFDMYGEPVTIEGSELLARAIQHETDHLDGVLFIDRLDTEARKAAMKEIRESEWFGLEQPTRQGQPAPHRRARALMRVVFAGTPEVAAARARRGRRRRPRAGRRGHPPRRPGRPRPQAGRQPGRPARRGARRTGAQARPPARPGVPGRRCASWRPTAARWSPTARCCPQSALDIPQHGWVNLHFSVLPAWRGAAPVQHAIWAGDEVTGATTFRIVKELDAGPTFGVMTETDPARPTPPATCSAGSPRAAPGCWSPPSTASRTARSRPASSRPTGSASRPKITVERRPGRLDRAGRRRRPPDPRLHARPRAPGRRTTGSGSRSARSRPTPTSRLAPGEPRGHQERRPRRHRHRRRCGSGEVKAFGKKQMAAADWARGVRLEPGARFGDPGPDVR